MLKFAHIFKHYYLGLSLIGIIFMPMILRAQGTEAIVCNEAMKYLYIILGGLVFCFLYNYYANILRASRLTELHILNTKSSFFPFPQRHFFLLLIFLEISGNFHRVIRLILSFFYNLILLILLT